MDLGKKLHMSLDDLIKAEQVRKKSSKGSEKASAKVVKPQKKKQDASAKLKVDAGTRKKTRPGRSRPEGSAVRGGKRGQSAPGKRGGGTSAVRVRFSAAPKVMARQPSPAQPSLANLVNNFNVSTKKEAQKALRLAKQLEAKAQQLLGPQQTAQHRQVAHVRHPDQAAQPVSEYAQRQVAQRGPVRRALQQSSPPADPRNFMHDPSRYDRTQDEYVDGIEPEDVKPNIATLRARRQLRSYA